MKTVAFAVAANKWQHSKWWVAYANAYARAMSDPEIEVVGQVVKSQALPGHNKNHAVELAQALAGKRRLSLTDSNRNAAVDAAMEMGADYIYWWDDDTIHPSNTLKQLLSLGLPFVSGLYYLKQPPCPPLAYIRNDNGSYRPMVNFRRGELIEVDSVGMGCSLISREVYDAIRQTHQVYRRENFSLLPLPTAAIEHVDIKKKKWVERLGGKVVGGVYIESLTRLSEEEVKGHPFSWPYYLMEYGRTEDHFFCEMAERAGYKPMVDTSVNCQHWGERPITRRSFLELSDIAWKELAEIRSGVS